MNIEDLRKQADLRQVYAETILGICYLEGIDVEIDYDKALPLLSSAAEKGAPRALAALAKMYLGGLGVSQNASRAIQLYEAAAMKGEFLAQIALGRIYSEGVYTSRDPHAASKWYAAALSQQTVVDAPEELQEAKEYLETN